MAYGLKYYYDLYWDHDSANNDYRIGFYFDGFASTETQLIPTDAPLIHNIDGQKDVVDHVIMGSEMQLQFIVAKSLRPTYDSDFLSSNYKDCIVKIIEDPTGSATVKWTGILNPRNCDRTYQGYKIVYSVSAVDLFADLKKKYYTSDGTTTGANYSGFDNILSIIKTSISKIADITELQLPFRIQLGTYSDLMTSTENALKENEVLQELFYESKDGEIETDTCYDVIEKVLKTFYCSIVQWDGYYQIFCHSERSSYYFEYDWSTLTEQSRTARNRTVTFFSASETMDLFGSGGYSKLEGLQHIYTRIRNRDSNLPLIPNGQFESDITGWDNGDADDDSNDFTGFTWDDLAGVGGTLEATWAGSATTGKYNFHHNTPFTVDLANDPGVTVRYALQVTSATPVVGNPKVQVRLWNATDGYLTSGNGQHNLVLLGDLYMFEDTFDTSSLTEASNYLDFEMEVVSPGTTQITLNIDYITVTQASTFTPTDWLLHFRQTSELQIGIKEYDIYICDQLESERDVCSIRDSGGSYTSTWDRYGETDTLPISYLLTRQILNDNDIPPGFVRCNIYDPDQDIMPFSVFYDTTSIDTYYRIVGMNMDYRKGTIDVNMVESDFIGADTNFFSNLRKLNSSYGS